MDISLGIVEILAALCGGLALAEFFMLITDLRDLVKAKTKEINER